MISHPNRSRRASSGAKVSEQTRGRQALRARSAHDHDREYAELLRTIPALFHAAAAGDQPTLFTTDADAGVLWTTYLTSMPPAERQVHDCQACRRFIEQHAGLVTITEDGTTIPVIGAGHKAVPDFYRSAFSRMNDHVRRSRVTGIFLTERPVWGTPVTGRWRHLTVTPPPALVHRGGALTAGQAMAAARENYRTVSAALADFSPATLDQVLRVLEAGAVDRAAKFIGPARWLRNLHDRPAGRRGDNMLWRAVATAPEGYCHPRSSVLGPLLDDVAAGVSFDAIKRRFDAMVDPLRYQRPQAAPAAGNIKAAEDLVAKLGIARSTERRFARIEDIAPWCAWRPAARNAGDARRAKGVFADVEPRGARARVPPVDLPQVTMTWKKFFATVLPAAERLELLVPHGMAPFIALTTAAHADAPPILTWDREGQRNPVSWYVYPRGSLASQWGLVMGAWVSVTAVASLPCLWGVPPMPFIGDGDVLVLDGAVDQHAAGSGLYPGFLRGDLHAVRSTIEAHSRMAKLEGRDQATACGWDMRNSERMRPCTLRARTGGAWSCYLVDRWD